MHPCPAGVLPHRPSYVPPPVAWAHLTSVHRFLRTSAAVSRRRVSYKLPGTHCRSSVRSTPSAMRAHRSCSAAVASVHASAATRLACSSQSQPSAIRTPLPCSCHHLSKFMFISVVESERITRRANRLATLAASLRRCPASAQTPTRSSYRAAPARSLRRRPHAAARWSVRTPPSPARQAAA